MYIPLRVFSPFSVGFGAVQTDKLVAYCRENDIPAAGIADCNTLGGALTVSKSLSSNGIQPITGITLDVRQGDIVGALTLFATSQAGYTALLRAANARNLADTPEAMPLSRLAELLGEDARNLVALSGGADGILERMLDQGHKIHDTCSTLAAEPDRVYRRA